MGEKEKKVVSLNVTGNSRVHAVTMDDGKCNDNFNPPPFCVSGR